MAYEYAVPNMDVGLANLARDSVFDRRGRRLAGVRAALARQNLVGSNMPYDAGAHMAEGLAHPIKAMAERAAYRVAGHSPDQLEQMAPQEIAELQFNPTLMPEERGALDAYRKYRDAQAMRTMSQMSSGLIGEIAMGSERLQDIARARDFVGNAYPPAVAGFHLANLDNQALLLDKDLQRKRGTVSKIFQNSDAREAVAAQGIPWEGRCPDGRDPLFFTAGFQATPNPDDAFLRMCIDDPAAAAGDPDNYYWWDTLNYYNMVGRRNGPGYPPVTMSGMPPPIPGMMYDTSLVPPLMNPMFTKVRRPVSAVAVPGSSRSRKSSRKSKSSRRSRSGSRTRSSSRRSRSRSRSRSRGIAV